MLKWIYKVLTSMLWIFNTILFVIPLACSFFISNENFTDDQKIGVLIAGAVLSLVTYRVSQSNNSVERAHNVLSDKILYGEENVAKIRYDLVFESFKNDILHNKTHQKLNYNPYEKIALILKKISECFEIFSDIREKYVSVSIFYRFDFQEDDKWSRLDKNYCPAYENNKEVILEEDSFGKYVMEGTEGFYWLNNKNRDGVKKKRYKLNPKDIETKNKFHKYGSIIGSKIVVKIDGKEYIQALLTISTYGKKIYEDPFEINKGKIECRIEDVILPVFKTEIMSELLQIYLEENKSGKGKNKK